MTENCETAPITTHEEWIYEGGDTFLVKSWTEFNRDSISLHRSWSYGESDAPHRIWDYAQYMGSVEEGEPSEREWWIEFHKGEDGCYKGELPYLNSSRSKLFFERYRVEKKLYNTNPDCSLDMAQICLLPGGDFAFPFDKYKFNMSRSRMEFSELYSVNVEFPLTFGVLSGKNYTINGSCVIGRSISKGSKNETGQIVYRHVGDIWLKMGITRQLLTKSKEDKRVFMLLPTPLVGYQEYPHEDLPDRLSLSFEIERVPLVKYLFYFSVALMLIVFTLYAVGKINLIQLSQMVFGIWVFQEGIFELTSLMRPNNVTLFDLSFMVPVTLFILYHLTKRVWSFMVRGDIWNKTVAFINQVIGGMMQMKINKNMWTSLCGGYFAGAVVAVVMAFVNTTIGKTFLAGMGVPEFFFGTLKAIFVLAVIGVIMFLIGRSKFIEK